MSREILFRGKRVDNGEWVEGYLMDENYINVPFNDNDVNGRFDDPVEVYPETVCKYTGLTDKNGRKIFENDIVRAIYKPKGEDLTVDDFIIKWDKYYCGYVGYYAEKENLYNPLLFGSRTSFEVIGNIFDNLKLLVNPIKR